MYRPDSATLAPAPILTRNAFYASRPELHYLAADGAWYVLDCHWRATWKLRPCDPPADPIETDEPPGDILWPAALSRLHVRAGDIAGLTPAYRALLRRWIGRVDRDPQKMPVPKGSPRNRAELLTFARDRAASTTHTAGGTIYRGTWPDGVPYEVTDRATDQTPAAQAADRVATLEAEHRELRTADDRAIAHGATYWDRQAHHQDCRRLSELPGQLSDAARACDALVSALPSRPECALVRVAATTPAIVPAMQPAPLPLVLDAAEVTTPGVPDWLDRVPIPPGWGAPYGGAAYLAPEGPRWLYRQSQRCRWYDADGHQVGPEQSNVCPAVAYALSLGWERSEHLPSAPIPEPIRRRQLATDRAILAQGQPRKPREVRTLITVHADAERIDSRRVPGSADEALALTLPDYTPDWPEVRPDFPPEPGAFGLTPELRDLVQAAINRGELAAAVEILRAA